MLGDRAAAEDCAQDAFERAYKKWPTWQPIAPAEAWVHRIAINAAVSYQRKMRLREVGEVIRRIGRPGLAPTRRSSSSTATWPIGAGQAAAEAGGGDRAPPLPRLHQPCDRPGAGHPGADRRLAPGGRQGAAARDAEALLRPRGRRRKAARRTRLRDRRLARGNRPSPPNGGEAGRGRQ